MIRVARPSLAPARHRKAARAALVFALAAVGGCGSDGPAASGDADGYMTARIDGQAWSSDPLYVDVGVQSPAGGLYVVQGTQLSGTALTVSLALTNISGPGTYPLGTGANVAGGSATVGQANAGWGTPLSGAAGTITIATMTDSRITGTFAFTASPSNGSATGNRTVTEGRFDLPLAISGDRTPPPPTSLNTISATIGGTTWNAASVALQQNVESLWGFAASNDQYSLSIAVAAPTGPGTYTLSNVVPLRMATVGGPGPGTGGPNCCWSSLFTGSGSITIATWDGTRATGSFTFTLGPTSGSQASAPIAVASGTFDVGIPQ